MYFNNICNFKHSFTSLHVLMGIYAPFKMMSHYFFIISGEPAFKFYFSSTLATGLRSSTCCLDIGLRHMFAAPFDSKRYLVPTLKDLIVHFVTESCDTYYISLTLAAPIK